jgi:hypothetical protein
VKAQALAVPEWYRYGVSHKASTAAKRALSVPDSPAEWRAFGRDQAARLDSMAKARAALYELLAQGLIEPRGNHSAWVDQLAGEQRRKARDAAYSAAYRAAHGDPTKAARDAKRLQRERDDPAFAEKRRAQRREQKRRARLRAKGLLVPSGPGAELQAVWAAVAAVR